MQTCLIAIWLLFPNIETTSIKPLQNGTEWIIKYEIQSKTNNYITINNINCFISGNLWNNTSHTRKVKLNNLHLFLKKDNFIYMNDVCGSGNYKEFKVRILNEQERKVSQLLLTPGQKFFIILTINHDHKPESRYDILRGYLDIRLMIGQKRLDYHAVLAEQHRIECQPIKLKEPLEDFLSREIFKTPPHSIILSTVIDNTNSVYHTIYFEVIPKRKIKIKFYYYSPYPKQSQLELYIKYATTDGNFEKTPVIILPNKIKGWNCYESQITIPKNAHEMALQWECESGIVFIDDITITPEGLNP